MNLRSWLLHEYTSLCTRVDSLDDRVRAATFMVQVAAKLDVGSQQFIEIAGDHGIFDAPDYFPEWLKGLDGQRIRIRGYMRPDFGSENIRGFILARDIEACCFGPNTKSYHIIPTILTEGTTTDYIHLRPFDAVGTFRIQVEELTGDDGELEVAFVYVIEDAEVLTN